MKILDFGRFTIETPNSWIKINEQGIDSYVGRIVVDSTDTLDFDLGWYSTPLLDYDSGEFNGRMYFVSKYGRQDKLLDSSISRKHLILSRTIIDTINGRKAEVVSPIKPGIGITGIYIDSLWQSGNEMDKFMLYGINLKPENEQLVLDAFQTIKFNTPK